VEAVQADGVDLDAAQLALFAENPFHSYPTFQSVLSDSDMAIQLGRDGNPLRMGSLADGVARLRREGYDCGIAATDAETMAELSCLHQGDGGDPRSFDYAIEMKSPARAAVVAGHSRRMRSAFDAIALATHFATWFEHRGIR
jgi:hypothetical protein